PGIANKLADIGLNFVPTGRNYISVDKSFDTLSELAKHRKGAKHGKHHSDKGHQCQQRNVRQITAYHGDLVLLTALSVQADKSFGGINVMLPVWSHNVSKAVLTT